jgi:hypothetical protein
VGPALVPASLLSSRLIFDFHLGFSFGIFIWDFHLGFSFGILVWDFEFGIEFGTGPKAGPP